MSNKPPAQEAELARLRARVAQQEAELYRLGQWLDSLNRDLRDVYHSFTWRIGYALTRLILFVLRKPLTPTAEHHAKRVAASFDAWQQDFFSARQARHAGLLPYMAWHPLAEYTAWWQRYYPPANAETLRQQARAWGYKPRFSLCLVLPDAFNPLWLEELLASVRGQMYENWELLLVYEEKSLFLQEIASCDSRICRILCAPEMPWADAANCLLAAAQGEFIAWLTPHDRLADITLYRLAERLNQQPGAVLLYGDEDKLDAAGQRHDPYFKPDWDEDLFHAQPYLGPFTVYRREAVAQAGGFSHEYPGAEQYDLILRLCSLRQRFGYAQRESQGTALPVEHLAEILYHRRAPEDDTSQGFAQPDQAKRALEAHFQRRNTCVQVSESVAGHLRVSYPLPDPAPLVSVLIPTRDRLALLRGTVEGLLKETDYPALEVMILDNGSREPETLDYLRELANDARVKVMHAPGPFNFSRLNNLGAAQARGEVLALLNNDLQIIHRDWLKEMAGLALRPEVGVVGAKLYYPDNRLQHAGVITGLGGMAGHTLKFTARDAPGYHWLPFVTHQCSAVTAACLVLRKAVFDELGGLDERLQVAFNDVDFCLRLGERGYRVLWTPHAELYHLESASRGADYTVRKYFRLQGELSFMRKRWAGTLAQDPYYNPNLTIQYEDYALAYPPRIAQES